MADRYLSPEQFRAAAKSEGAAAERSPQGEAQLLADVVVRVAAPVEVKAADDGGERSVTFVLSTDSIDRQGDRIMQDGWKLDTYRKNPVVCWAHDYALLPLAKARDVKIEDGKLKAKAVFTPPGQLKFNDAVYDLLVGGFLNACSVGFQPRKWNWAEDDNRRFGIDFMEQELLEFSVVPVPANAEALVEARSKGLDAGPVAEWARRVAGIADGHEVVSAERMAELLAAEQELRTLKAAALVDPSPARFPRLTARALDFAKVARAV